MPDFQFLLLLIVLTALSLALVGLCQGLLGHE